MSAEVTKNMGEGMGEVISKAEKAIADDNLDAREFLMATIYRLLSQLTDCCLDRTQNIGRNDFEQSTKHAWTIKNVSKCDHSSAVLRFDIFRS